MIRLDQVVKTYARGSAPVHALRGVSLTIESGECVAIMGPSGSGKSTLLNILGLLDVPDSGTYTLMGEDAGRLPDDSLALLRNQRIGFVFQQFNLIPRITALENASLPQLYSGGRMDREKTRRLLDDVGLGDRIRHRPNELSGGQQQRVAIARALVNQPGLILADEPTGNLDSVSAEEIMQILERLNDKGITLIIVTHEMDIARHTRRIITMKDGRIQTDAPGGRPVVPGVSPRPLGESGRDVKSKPILRELPHHIRQAGRSMWANKVRAGLSMLGILIGVAAVIAMLALGTGARESIREQLSSMGSNLLTLRPGAQRMHGVSLETGAVTRFTPEDVLAIRNRIAGATQVAGAVSGRGQVVYGNANWNTQVLGTEPDYASMRNSEPATGRFFTESECRERARVAVIGMTLVRKLFGDSPPLGEYIRIDKIAFQVIGVLPEKGATGWRDHDDIVMIPLNTAMYRLMGKTFLDSIDVQIAREKDMPAAQEAIRDLIVRAHRLPPSQQDSFDIRNMAEIQAAVTETSRTMSLLLSSIAAISLLVGGIGIMNIMLVSVTERTKEIGLRKAIGARRRDILVQFLAEALGVSVTGGALGILLGWGITEAIARFAGWRVILTPASVGLALGFSLLIGVVFGLWPALKAAKLNPMDALRYE